MDISGKNLNGERMMLASPPGQKVYIATIEDTILAKLVWYRLGGHVSERQRRDVCELIKIHHENLDLTYLDHWAVELDVQELLHQVLHEAMHE